MTAPQVKNQKPSVSVKDEKTFEKEEHKVIYDAFVKSLENKKQSKELKEDDKAVLAFMLSQNQTIFKNVELEDIKSLSEENFCQLLLSVFKEIREKKLANEENLKNGEIEKVVAECVADIRGTEAKDSLIKLAGWLFGVKVDPKNFFSSFKDGLLEKVPFLGKGKKEEDEPPLSDEEMVTTFLRKIFFPILFSIASILIFGPTTLAVVAAGIGAIFAIKGGIEVLFLNDKKGTLYNPHSQDEKQKKEWDNEISDGINKILEIPVGKAKGSEQLTSIPERVPQVESHNQSWTEKEDERKEETIGRVRFAKK